MDDKQNENPPVKPGSGGGLGGVGPAGQVMQIQLHTGKGTTEIKKLFKFHKRRIIIGSAHSCDIRIRENTVSNVHAVIEMKTDGQVHIYDMASESGIFVNEEKTVSTDLNDGDVVKIGYATLTFQLGEVDEEPTKNIALPQSMRHSGKQRLYFSQDEDFKPLILEDEREVIEIFEYPYGDNPSLQVAVYWGQTILDIEHYVEEEAVWVGSESGVDFLVPQLPNTFPLVTLENGQHVLHLSEEMTGIVRTDDMLQSIDELKESLRASPSGMSRTIALNDLVKLQIGEITIFLSYTAAPPRIKPRRVFEKDALFFKFWLMSLILTVAMIFGALSMEKPEKLSVDEVPKRVTKVIFKPPPKPPALARKAVRNYQKSQKALRAKARPKPRPQPKPMVRPMPMPLPMVRPMPQPMRTTPTMSAMKNPTPKQTRAMTRGRPKPAPMRTMRPAGNRIREGEGAMARGKEGARGSRRSRRRGPMVTARGSGSRASGGARTKGAGGRGTIETLAKDLGGSIAKSLSGGSRGASRSAGRLQGYGGFTTRGDGGLGETGTGTGGGGKSATIAGLGTKGIGPGKTGTGTGLGSGSPLGSRGRPTIQLGDATETVIMGGLDKDVIDAIIKKYFNQIRYCYEKELSGATKQFSGRVMTRFVISSSGRVSKAAVAASSLRNANVHSCLTGVLKRIVFPEPLGGGIVEVSYPFVFQPAVK